MFDYGLGREHRQVLWPETSNSYYLRELKLWTWELVAEFRFDCSDMNRQREPKDRASGRIGHRPEPSSVSFDNRTADRQPHAHALWLGRIEGVEKTVKTFWIDTWARISHRNHYMRTFSVGQGSVRVRAFRFTGDLHEFL